MKIKTVFRNSAIAAIFLIVSHPLIAKAIPQSSRTACIRSTAEEMGVGVFDVAIASVGPVSAESGAVTVNMQNKKTGQTAECRVNTIDNTVLSVKLTNSASSNSAGRGPEFWVVTASKTLLKPHLAYCPKQLQITFPRAPSCETWAANRGHLPGVRLNSATIPRSRVGPGLPISVHLRLGYPHHLPLQSPLDNPEAQCQF
uniref:Uncharacterized protein n=1 Tax=Cyanothece sp. (strain PCC 7425 / ATCC 29141) TaxID=395961 RepID=B8HZH6_CYAP4